MADPPRASVYLFAARPGAERSARLSALIGTLGPECRVALLLDGARQDAPEPAFGAAVTVHIVAGCPCCVGSLPLKVTLARILRLERPQVVVIVASLAEHLERLEGVLQSPPYDAFLTPMPWPEGGASVA